VRISAWFLAAFLALAPAAAVAGEASEAVKRTCRSVSSQTARTIALALRANIDPATQVRKVPDSWLEGVQAHMLLAASRAPHLAEDELASLGYSHCVSRRPTDR
jgi:AcrR family transcriptional regulator